MSTTNQTIVYFNIGRGGRFNNSGFKSFKGTKNLSEVLSQCDSNGQCNFLAKENESEIYSTLKKGGYDNLLSLFEKCRDNSDFTEFEKRTGLELGEDVYNDCNGNHIIDASEVEEGVGVLEWDGDYDTDICQYLDECDEDELMLILNSSEYNNEDLISEYFNNNAPELNIDWAKFDGNYEGLIYEYFNGEISIEEFYNDGE
jgi:hypothetical protein